LCRGGGVKCRHDAKAKKKKKRKGKSNSGRGFWSGGQRSASQITKHRQAKLIYRPDNGWDGKDKKGKCKGGGLSSANKKTGGRSHCKFFLSKEERMKKRGKNH